MTTSSGARVARLGEFELIARLRERCASPRADVRVGIGDDGAVLRVPRGQQLVVAMDTLVEGVHFPRATAPSDIAWKALAVNLSDLAAMGATPAWVTLALTLPRAWPRWLDEFATGFAQLARAHGVSLVGGDTTRGPLTLTVQAHGFVPPGAALLRSAARVGDAIYISGTLGDAAAGLAIAQHRLSRVRKNDAAWLCARLNRPTPRVALGLALRGLAHAAIDVSDGLCADLTHVLDASRVGAEIELAQLPSSAALRRAVPDAARRARWQLAGGDDYELCFTAPNRARARIEALARRLHVPLTRIGTITRRRGLRVLGADGAELPLRELGYVHF
jgi:thiamine-monophosphate kinase